MNIKKMVLTASGLFFIAAAVSVEHAVSAPEKRIKQTSNKQAIPAEILNRLTALSPLTIRVKPGQYTGVLLINSSSASQKAAKQIGKLQRAGAIGQLTVYQYDPYRYVYLNRYPLQGSIVSDSRIRTAVGDERICPYIWITNTHGKVIYSGHIGRDDTDISKTLHSLLSHRKS